MTTLTLAMSRSIGRQLKAGDVIVLSRMDHDANVAPWLLLADDMGLNVRWLEFNRETFEFDAAAIEAAITEDVQLVCVGGASNLTGTLNDVAAIAARARDVGALSYIDAVQSVPHVATDVQQLGCDILVCSAYKFFGPHQGILWGRRELLESLFPYKVRPADDVIPGRYETGTQSHEGMAGTAAAVEYFADIGKRFGQAHEANYPDFSGRCLHAHTGMDYLFGYEQQLSAHLIAGLSALPGVTVQGISNAGLLERRVPTVSFTHNDKHPSEIAKALGERGIFVWSGHNYAIEPATSLGLMDTGGVVRIGPVHYNSLAEIDALLNELESIL